MDPKAEYVSEYIMHHIVDGHKWHVPFLPTIPVPYPLSLHALMIIICGILLFFLFGVLYDKKSAVPRGVTNLLEVFVLFVRDEICIPSLGEKDGRRMTPIFCTFFFLILGLNLMGLIPLFVTATANMSVTAGLSIITLGFMIIGGLWRHGLIKFLKVFIPSGVPVPILPLIFTVEFASMFIRCFALTIRLFANMLAGHIVILSLLGAFITIGIKVAPIFLLVVFLYLLEILIAFLQAYIFTLFSALFIGFVYHPDH